MDLLRGIQNLGQDVFGEDVGEQQRICRVSARGININVLTLARMMQKR